MNAPSLIKMNFDYDRMGLTCVYRHGDFGDEVIDLPEVRRVLGEPFRITSGRPDRPYLYNSVVTSIDGKIAFEDAPQGPMIASKNRFGLEDATIDWWMLNLLRASADAIIFGANTLVQEPTATGHVYDDSLEQWRLTHGKSAVPLNIIPTLDGLDIPSNHIEFHSPQIPVLFYTVKASLSNLKAKFPNLAVLEPDSYSTNEQAHKIQPGHPAAIVCGTGTVPNPHLLLRFLKMNGVHRVLVESPFITHLFLREGLMDELFINTSGVYVGGNALSLGKSGQSFLSQEHPHTSLMSMHVHSPHFLYTRYALMREGSHD